MIQPSAELHRRLSVCPAKRDTSRDRAKPDHPSLSRAAPRTDRGATHCLGSAGAAPRTRARREGAHPAWSPPRIPPRDARGPSAGPAMCNASHQPRCHAPSQPIQRPPIQGRRTLRTPVLVSRILVLDVDVLLGKLFYVLLDLRQLSLVHLLPASRKQREPLSEGGARSCC